MKIGRLAAVLLASSVPLAGQQFEIHHQFVETFGISLDKPLLAADGSLYIVGYGGDYAGGQIFQIVPDGGGGYTLETLHSFRGPDGTLPNSLMQGADGRLYGTCVLGGANGRGTVFSFDPAAGLVVLHTFPSEGSPDVHPHKLVQASDGNLYGTTRWGGVGEFGTTYRLTPNGDFTLLNNMDEAIWPVGPLLQASDGFLYGTTHASSAGGGTLYRMDLSGNITVLHHFSGFEGLPNGDLVQAPDGYIYGTAQNGGSFLSGTVFRSDLSGNVTILHHFSPAAGEGSNPLVWVEPSGDGSLYGITSNGGPSNGGTVFRILPNGDYEIVATFPNADPDLPPTTPHWGLTVLPDGTLLGTTIYGGLQNAGVLFRVPLPQTGSFEALAPFGAPRGPIQPTSELTQTADGTLWGAAGGGSAYLGTIYRLSGGPLTAHEFTGADGATPGNLFAASDGNLYGVTESQGAGGAGTVFRLDTSGVLTTLHAFAGADGAQPKGGLMEANDGNFYGTTGFGGANGGGTLYRLTPSGTHSKLHDFSANPVPEEPRGRILQASDGMLYFTGFGLQGTLYRSDLAGNVTDIHDFVGNDGENPVGGVIQADDGNLYGTCLNAGAGSEGTVFRFGPPSTYGVIHAFSNFQGHPSAGLVQASDGRLYGTTPWWTPYGTIFSVDLAGTDFQTVHTFNRYPDGADPVASLMQASDGMLYGTTRNGGVLGLGVVFRLDLAGSAPAVGGLDPDSGLASGGVPLTILGNHLRRDTAATVGEVAFAAPYEFEARRMFTLTPPLTPGTLNDVTVTNGDGQSATLARAFFADFLDAAGDNRFHAEIETIFREGITAGCGGGNYCSDAPTTRAQMAVLLLKLKHGGEFTPPPCTGVFLDVDCPSLFADWIEQFAAEEITAGCGDAIYCPLDPITREQSAVLILKAEHGAKYEPPACAGLFADVPCTSPFAVWIEQLFAEGITEGCGNGNYCPDASTTRGQMAVFLTRALALP